CSRESEGIGKCHLWPTYPSTQARSRKWGGIVDEIICGRGATSDLMVITWHCCRRPRVEEKVESDKNRTCVGAASTGMGINKNNVNQPNSEQRTKWQLDRKSVV